VPAADPLTRTVTVKVDLAGKGLKSGQFGRASLPMATRKGLLVPRSAIVEQGSLTSVWVVGNDRIVRLRLVKPGREQGATTEILSGLTAGESIVVSGIEKVADGARIQ
jgi:multidrug efflux system membrane fusion protein